MLKLAIPTPQLPDFTDKTCVSRESAWASLFNHIDKLQDGVHNHWGILEDGLCLYL
jgi:hypothetical protein